jgi:FKBP-type peptidyl-prolyl cis-trans isomerase
MKKLLVVVVCLVLPALSLHARAIQEENKKAEENVRVSYAFGMLMGSNLNSIQMEYDYVAFAEGFKDMVEGGNTRFTEQEAMEIVETAIQNAMEKQAGENREREEQFFAQNRERAEVKETPSGLQYEILEETEGDKPGANSVVRVFYEGTFIDGSPFDSSDEDDGAFIPLEMVIAGWTEGLQLMSVGSKYRFYIPSNLGYGQEGIQGVIPPYSPLIFNVELLEIMNDNPFSEMFQQQDDQLESADGAESAESVDGSEGGGEE